MFNFSQKPAFGLDLSDLSFKAVQIEKRKGGLALTNSFTQEIPPGLVKGGEIQKEKELVELFKKTFSQAEGGIFQNSRVVCNLPEEKVFIRVIQLPRMKEAELEKAVIFEAEAHIPLGINEVYLGWQVIEPIFEHIDHLDVLIAAAPQTMVDKYLSVLKKSGLKPIALEPESIAVVRSLTSKNDLTPSIIVDFGAVGTNFVIFSALAIRFTSHFNISGQILNQAIVKELGVDEKEANRLKIEVGLDQEKEGGRVAKALKPVVDDLAKQIGEYISFYREHTTHVHGPDGAIGQVILCGGDSLLNNLANVLTEKLNLPVKMGNPLANLSSADKKRDKKSALSRKKAFAYTTALGLALRELI